MQITKLTLAALATATTAYAQQQCTKSSYDGSFQLNPVNLTSSSPRARPLRPRQANCAAPNALVVKLANGVLTDSQGRIGSIVANYQFQFDGPPPQAGALVVDGYSICGNNSLATNGRAVWYQCSDLTRTSIYGPNLTPIGNACYQVYYEVIPCGAPASGGAAISVQPDGQPGVTKTSPCVPVTTLSDGQPVVSSCPATTSTCVPITTLSDGQPVVKPCPTSVPASTATCVPITTLSDGQPVVKPCPTSAPASTATCVPITTLSDGQPVVKPCPTSSASVPTLVANATTGVAVPGNKLSINAASSLQSLSSFIAAAIVGVLAVVIL